MEMTEQDVDLKKVMRISAEAYDLMLKCRCNYAERALILDTLRAQALRDAIGMIEKNNKPVDGGS